MKYCFGFFFVTALVLAAPLAADAQSVLYCRDSTLATADALGAFFSQMFNVELVVVPATYKTDTGATGRFMGDHIALAFLDSSTAAPTFAATFVEQGTNTTGEGATLAGIREERIEDPMGVKIIADVMYKAQVENSIQDPG